MPLTTKGMYRRFLKFNWSIHKDSLANVGFWARNFNYDGYEVDALLVKYGKWSRWQRFWWRINLPLDLLLESL